MNNKLEELRKLRSERIKLQSNSSNEHNRAVLFRAIEKYGHDAVMVASGWKQSTILQYLRNPKSTISNENLRLTTELLKEVFGH